jgi:hypothetical protein
MIFKLPSAMARAARPIAGFQAGRHRRLGGGSDRKLDAIGRRRELEVRALDFHRLSQL